MKTFAKQTGPVLAGVVRERTMKDVLAQIRNYEVHGANAIDLHLSSLNDEYGINTDVEQLNLGIARDMIDKLNRMK